MSRTRGAPYEVGLPGRAPSPRFLRRPRRAPPHGSSRRAARPPRASAPRRGARPLSTSRRRSSCALRRARDARRRSLRRPRGQGRRGRKTKGGGEWVARNLRESMTPGRREGSRESPREPERRERLEPTVFSLRQHTAREAAHERGPVGRAATRGLLEDRQPVFRPDPARLGAAPENQLRPLGARHAIEAGRDQLDARAATEDKKEACPRGARLLEKQKADAPARAVLKLAEQPLHERVTGREEVEVLFPHRFEIG